jgi:hypothetical protein
MENEHLFNKLKELILNNKAGFTANEKADILNLNKGFAVSVTNNKTTDINELVLNAVTLSKYFKNGFCFGGWYDENNKNYYLDISFIINEKNQALQTAKNFNQLAVFDFSTFNTITL